MLRNNNESKISSIIGPEVEVDGDVKVVGSILIYGKINGGVKATGSVRTVKGSYIKGNIESVSTYELLSPLLALCFGVPGSKKFKQQVNDLIRARDIKRLEDTYINLIAAWS